MEHKISYLPAQSAVFHTIKESRNWGCKSMKTYHKIDHAILL